MTQVNKFILCAHVILADKVDVLNPYYDYVGPKLITAYMTSEWALDDWC